MKDEKRLEFLKLFDEVSKKLKTIKQFGVDHFWGKEEDQYAKPQA